VFSVFIGSVPETHNLILLPAALVHYRWNNGENLYLISNTNIIKYDGS